MLDIDPRSGLLGEAAYHPSPNCDERPSEIDIDLLVVHSISLPPGEYGGSFICDFFQNKLAPNAHPYFQQISHLKVSAHVLIGRDGEFFQFVPFHKRAWHAGVSSFEGREKCNDFSIGIELEGTDDTPFRTIQYWKLAQLINALRATYPSMSDCPVVGHSNIAPGRKTDPGTEFEWSRLRRLLATANGRLL
ncbi:MAG: 1,6-anhydro-N-acetylmuramyl-L-alanine amidase AmpD [Gammaproteobacteria bacterium]